MSLKGIACTACPERSKQAPRLTLPQIGRITPKGLAAERVLSPVAPLVDAPS